MVDLNEKTISDENEDMGNSRWFGDCSRLLGSRPKYAHCIRSDL